MNSDCRCGHVELIQFGRREADRRCTDVFDHVGHLSRSGNGHDPGFLGEQRDLPWRGLLELGPFLHQGEKRQIVRQVLLREPCHAGTTGSRLTVSVPKDQPPTFLQQSFTSRP